MFYIITILVASVIAMLILRSRRHTKRISRHTVICFYGLDNQLMINAALEYAKSGCRIVLSGKGDLDGIKENCEQQSTMCRVVVCEDEDLSNVVLLAKDNFLRIDKIIIHERQAWIPISTSAMSISQDCPSVYFVVNIWATNPIAKSCYSALDEFCKSSSNIKAIHLHSRDNLLVYNSLEDTIRSVSLVFLLHSFCNNIFRFLLSYNELVVQDSISSLVPTSDVISSIDTIEDVATSEISEGCVKPFIIENDILNNKVKQIPVIRSATVLEEPAKCRAIPRKSGSGCVSSSSPSSRCLQSSDGSSTVMEINNKTYDEATSRSSTVIPPDVVFVEPDLPHDLGKIDKTQKNIISTEPPLKQIKKICLSSKLRDNIAMQQVVEILTSEYDDWIDSSHTSSAKNEVTAAKQRAGQLPTIDLLLDDKGSELIVANWSKSDKLIKHTSKSVALHPNQSQASKDSHRCVLVNSYSYAKAFCNKFLFYSAMSECDDCRIGIPYSANFAIGNHKIKILKLREQLHREGITEPTWDVILPKESHSGVPTTELYSLFEGIKNTTSQNTKTVLVMNGFVENHPSDKIKEITAAVIVTPQYEVVIDRASESDVVMSQIECSISFILRALRPHLHHSRSTNTQSMLCFGVLQFTFFISPTDTILLKDISPLTSHSSIASAVVQHVINPSFNELVGSQLKRRM